MEIHFHSKFSTERVFLIAQIALGTGLCLLLLVMGIRGSVDGVDARISKERVRDLSKMLSGPLALRENPRSPLAISLENKLVFMAQSVRPDMEGERVLKIGVKGSSVERVVKEGEPIRCKLDVHEGGGLASVEFIDEGDAEIAVHKVDGNSLFLRVRDGANEAMELVLKASGLGRVNVPGGVGTLARGKLWGEDLFFQKYGGKTFQPMGRKVQVEVDKYVIYVGEGDFLTFHDGRWQVVDLSKAGRVDPLAKVVHVGSELELEAWDSKGFSLFQTKLQRERGGILRFVPGQVIQEAKMRTSRQVSCKLGKQRMVLQAGDWLLKRGDNWHKLKGKEEIDAFLGHELKGELLVIDSIDKSGLVRGNYFNEMRTEVQPFSFQAVSSLNNRKGRK